LNQRILKIYEVEGIKFDRVLQNQQRMVLYLYEAIIVQLKTKMTPLLSLHSWLV